MSASSKVTRSCLRSTAEFMCEDELLVVCAPSHPLAKLDSIAPGLLAQHAYISREPGSGTREVCDNYLQKVGSAADSLQPVMELGSPEALKGVVVTGRGFAIMSRSTVVKEARLGLLVGIPLAPRLVRKLALVYPKRKFHSKYVSNFKSLSSTPPRAKRARSTTSMRAVTDVADGSRADIPLPPQNNGRPKPPLVARPALISPPACAGTPESRSRPCRCWPAHRPSLPRSLPCRAWRAEAFRKRNATADR